MKIRILAALLACTLASQAQSTLNSVSTYDAPTNPNVVDVPNALAAFTYPMFTASLPPAWAANMGGVANFDSPQLLAPAFPTGALGWTDVRYGVGFGRTMRFWYSAGAAISAPVGGAVPISGNGTLRVPVLAPGTPFTIKFSPTPAAAIRAVGFTVLQQQTPQAIKVQFIQGGGAAPINASHVVPVGAPIPSQDVCFVRRATVGAGIVGVQIWVTNAITGAPISYSIDDVGFTH
jgi:hypothetical protein